MKRSSVPLHLLNDGFSLSLSFLSRAWRKLVHVLQL